MTKKNYFTISEIAKEFKVKRSQIRSYEKNGLISPGNDKLGRRIYNQFDRARLELIFHFEHIDYSPDQISGLIGILGVNLNKMEQFRNSLEYGEKKLDELEKRSKKIKFPDRISAINEMNIMRNYTEKLKKLEPLESATEITLKQKHIRMIPVFVGLSIIILFISSYFFYHGGIILNLAHQTEATPFLKAGPSVAWIKPTVPAKQGDRQLESKKILDKTISSISEVDRTENEDIAIKREPLDSNDTQLSPVSGAADKKNKPIIKYHQYLRSKKQN